MIICICCHENTAIKTLQKHLYSLKLGLYKLKKNFKVANKTRFFKYFLQENTILVFLIICLSKMTNII